MLSGELKWVIPSGTLENVVVRLARIPFTPASQLDRSSRRKEVQFNGARYGTPFQR
jgi:hypothetical protein